MGGLQKKKKIIAKVRVRYKMENFPAVRYLWVESNMANVHIYRQQRTGRVAFQPLLSLPSRGGTTGSLAMQVKKKNKK